MIDFSNSTQEADRCTGFSSEGGIVVAVGELEVVHAGIACGFPLHGQPSLILALVNGGIPVVSENLGCVEDTDVSKARRQGCHLGWLAISIATRFPCRL